MALWSTRLCFPKFMISSITEMPVYQPGGIFILRWVYSTFDIWVKAWKNPENYCPLSKKVIKNLHVMHVVKDLLWNLSHFLRTKDVLCKKVSLILLLLPDHIHIFFHNTYEHFFHTCASTCTLYHNRGITHTSTSQPPTKTAIASTKWVDMVISRALQVSWTCCCASEKGRKALLASVLLFFSYSYSYFLRQPFDFWTN